MLSKRLTQKTSFGWTAIPLNAIFPNHILKIIHKFCFILYVFRGMSIL